MENVAFAIEYSVILWSLGVLVVWERKRSRYLKRFENGLRAAPLTLAWGNSASKPGLTAWDDYPRSDFGKRGRRLG